MNRTLHNLWVVCAAVWLGLLTACEGDQPTPPPSDPSELRIVSMSPAITRVVVDLGLGDRVVGVHRFDPLADRYPVMGDNKEINYEKLLVADPTVVLLQVAADSVPRKLRHKADEHGWALHTYQIETVADVAEVIWNPRASGIGAAVGRRDAAKALRDRLIGQLDAIRGVTAGYPAPRVLVLTQTAPLGAAGPGTFVDELLTIAGGRNALPKGTQRYPVLDREAVLVMKPQVIVLLELKGDPANTAVPAALAGLNVPAIRDGRLVRLVDPMAQMPSTTMPRVAAKLAKLLHPQAAAELDAIMAGDG